MSREWADGFLACAFLFTGQYDRYAGIRDEYLGTKRDDIKATLRKLVFAARTSGGVAGRDEALCAACEAAEKFLEGKKT